MAILTGNPFQRASAFESAAAQFERPRKAWRVWRCDRDICDGLPHGDWADNHARPQQQIAPKGDWNYWLFMAGRGAGKTRTGAEHWARYGAEHTNHRVALVSATFGDTRDTMVEGESGLLSALERYNVLRKRNPWNRTLGEIYLNNGTRYKCFSADEPERLRGPQHHGAWVEEPGSWRYPDAWDQLLFGLRLGIKPRVIITGTPRNTALVRELLTLDKLVRTGGSTFDNAANLAPSALAALKRKYAGTRLGRQELDAELLTDIVGALVTLDLIDRHRITDDALPDLQHVLVSIDPAISAEENSDETGILVQGANNQHIYVLEDVSGQLSPDGWARRALHAWVEWSADGIVYERNQGGDMVAQTLITTYRDMVREGHIVGPEPRLIPVTATRGKRIRAEPIAALYEQGRVHHVGAFAQYEDQWRSWTQDSKDSPDRMDAGVWGATVLATAFGEHVGGGRFPIPA